MANRKHTRVVIVGGGGTMGSSTALHLIRQGYTPSNITVLDTYPIPSAQSAGNDLNKIMGVRTRSLADIMLSRDALDMWKGDDLFKEHFHQTGRVSCGMMLNRGLGEKDRGMEIDGQVDCASTPADLESLRATYDKLQEAGAGSTHEWLANEDEILAKAPHLSREQIKVRPNTDQASCGHTVHQKPTRPMGTSVPTSSSPLIWSCGLISDM
jgi:sarcosine oxidase/L-pipecolate oxidase